MDKMVALRLSRQYKFTMDTKGFPPLTVHSKLSTVFRGIPGENPVTSGGLGGYFRGVRSGVETRNKTKKKQN
jgi:hypothetical protein